VNGPDQTPYESGRLREHRLLVRHDAPHNPTGCALTLPRSPRPSSSRAPLPARRTYALEKQDAYRLYEWTVSKDQFDKATAAMRNIRADAGIFSLDRQCTSVAIETARGADISVPDGLGKVHLPWIPYSPTVSTPYHLDKELQQKSKLVPTIVGAEHLKDQLKIK
jgi:hypothetical protein